MSNWSNFKKKSSKKSMNTFVSKRAWTSSKNTMEISTTTSLKYNTLRLIDLLTPFSL